jgi:hypothetical protein
MASYGFPQSLSSFVMNGVEKKCITLQKSISLIKYNAPTQKYFFSKLDMALCFVYFNPARSTKLLMNYLYTIEKLRTSKIPFYTLELCYGDNAPEIKKAFHIFTREENVMFHKEQLCHLLEKQIPSQYTKLLFLDSDIIFENPSFYDEISGLLESYEIVQPFRTAKWIDAEYKKVIQERFSSALMNRKAPYDSINFHPGFGWAFKRSWFKKVGFFQYGITGSGDTLSVAAWLQISPPKVCFINAIKKLFNEFASIVKNYPPKITCANYSVYHLWHGMHKKRQYVSRHLILQTIEDVSDILEISTSGLFEYNYGRDHESSHVVSKISQDLTNYFLQREDDEV